ncbi:MAG TPA: tyrosine--tRNA ligase, partial [Candidatus Eremiobacteraceae bacterium]|nr:tyrosine--tRNA ligase [Candidatus Eremiobacteraceae bacterium]
MADVLSGRCVDVFSKEDLVKRLAEGRPLRVKLGIDPTGPLLHLGHAVVLRKLRQFQDLGHQAILIVGDFTAQIGDPSGRADARKPRLREDIRNDMKTYADQAGLILDMDKTEIRYNSEWLGKLSFGDIIELAGKTTVARMLERDDFSKRYFAQEPIGLHELLYPLGMGYDSVAVKADIELGGTEQLFNLLMGRKLQEEFGLASQICMTLPILEGTDGVQRMGKSLNNFIALREPPAQMFGKIMSLPDVL